MQRHNVRHVLVGMMAALVWAQAAAAQTATTPTLTIGGAVATPITLTPDQFKALPRAKAEVKEDGRTVVYEGAPVGEVLKRAGASLGTQLRGDAVASYVIATATDGYRAVYSLAELDPEFTHNDVIVADTVDGKPLFAYQGPFRLVAPKDARAARSVRMLIRLDVVRVTP